MTPPQVVIYRPDADQHPTWQFYSMPESIVGGADSIDEARQQYLNALAFALEYPATPPEIREYAEREIEGLGIWIRTPLESPLADPSWQRVASQIVQYPEEDREWFHDHLTAGGDPVVIPSTADVHLSAIFDQMTPYDSVIVVMAVHEDDQLRIAWLVIAGPDAGRDDDAPPRSLEQLGLTPDSSLGEFADIAIKTHGDRTPELLAPAIA